MATAPTGRRTISDVRRVDDVQRAPEGTADRHVRGAAARRLQRAQRAGRDRGRRGRRPEHRHDGRRAAPFKGVRRRLQQRGTAAGSPSTTTSRIIRPRSTRRWRGVRSAHPDRASGRSSSRDRRRRAGGLPGRTSRAFAEADASSCPPSSDRRCPTTSGCRPSRSSRARGARRRRALHPAVDDIVATVVAKKRGGDLVVIMSNGGFDDIHQKLLDALERRATAVNPLDDFRIVAAGDMRAARRVRRRSASIRINERCVLARGAAIGNGSAGHPVRDVVVGYAR